MAVNRDEEFWMSFSVEPFYIFLVAVTCGMDEVFARCAVAYDAYSLSGQSIFHFLHLKFISGNNGSGEYDCVSFVQFKLCMSFIRYAVERSKFFSLRSGHQNHHFV